jgi:hypothetical protein
MKKDNLFEQMAAIASPTNFCKIKLAEVIETTETLKQLANDAENNTQLPYGSTGYRNLSRISDNY